MRCGAVELYLKGGFIALAGIIIAILGFLTYFQTSADNVAFLSIGAIIVGLSCIIIAIIVVIRKRGT
jgi:hypothetical protein